MVNGAKRRRRLWRRSYTLADTYHLSYAIGPVQEFVAQARRTRDLWAGSWLLSYLAESALAAAERAGGTAIIPFRSDADRGIVTAKRSPIGGMPNRFELTFEGPDARSKAIQAAQAARSAFDTAWNHVADAVFQAFLGDLLGHGKDTKAIWERQVDKFWQTQWGVGQPVEGERTIGSLAGMRKNFRNVPAGEEPGVKCSLMPTLQELSGYCAGSQQQEFWRQLRRKVGELDLGESERLCAIALIKRLFPKVIERALGGDVSPSLHQVAWPSTAFVAAIPWLSSLSGEAQSAAKAYQRMALAAGYQESERQAALDAGVKWAGADGPIWFSSAVRNDGPGQESLGINSPKEKILARRAKVRELLDQLLNVYREAGASQGDDQHRPVPYYALLLMDGDSMGALLQQLGSVRQLSECLNRFSEGVDTIIRQHCGRTVYAGGDDVLAILPAKCVLPAATELRAAYAGAFHDNVAQNATISASVVYAHWRYPLRQVLRTAHQLLDDIAKDATGRDAIAIGIILGSGLSAVWATPWDVFTGTATARDGRGETIRSVALSDILHRFDSQATDESEDPPFNASFLYLLRERFGHLLGEGHVQPGQFLRCSDSSMSGLLRDLAHAEYRRRLKKSIRAKKTAEQTKTIINELMSLSHHWRRKQAGSDVAHKTVITCDPNAFTFDGWRVARFLKQIEDGKVGDHD